MNYIDKLCFGHVNYVARIKIRPKGVSVFNPVFEAEASGYVALNNDFILWLRIQPIMDVVRDVSAGGRLCDAIIKSAVKSRIRFDFTRVLSMLLAESMSMKVLRPMLRNVIVVPFGATCPPRTLREPVGFMVFVGTQIGYATWFGSAHDPTKTTYVRAWRDMPTEDRVHLILGAVQLAADFGNKDAERLADFHVIAREACA